MSGSAAAELLRLVDSRYDFLAVLDEGEYEKRELRELLGVSRSTVDRTIRELESDELVCRGENGYRTTLYGRVAVAIYESLFTYLQEVRRAKQLLVGLPHDLDLDLQLLLDGEIHLAEKPAPHVPMSKIVDSFETADRLYSLAYGYPSLETFEAIEEQIVELDVDAHLVFRPKTYSSLSELYPDRVSRLVEKESCSISVAETLAFGLFVLFGSEESHVCLISYDNSQNPIGVLVDDAPSSVKWGKTTFDRYRARAQRVPELES